MFFWIVIALFIILNWRKLVLPIVYIVGPALLKFFRKVSEFCASIKKELW